LRESHERGKPTASINTEYPHPAHQNHQNQPIKISQSVRKKRFSARIHLREVVYAHDPNLLGPLAHSAALLLKALLLKALLLKALLLKALLPHFQRMALVDFLYEFLLMSYDPWRPLAARKPLASLLAPC